VYFIYKPIKYNPKFVSDTHVAVENTRYRIPHIFWSYWHDPDNVPNVVNECFISWRRNYPTYSIIIVNSNTISKFISRDELPRKFDQIKAHQLRSDFIRLALLKKYGGIWMDASILIIKPIEPIWLDHKYDLALFNQPLLQTIKDKTVAENWFISAPKNSKIIELWSDEFTHGVDDFNTLEEYYDNLEKEGVDLQNVRTEGTYLSMHASFLAIQNKYPVLLRNIYTEPANNVNNPLYYVVNKNIMIGCFSFLNNFYFDKYNHKQPMIKLIGATRICIDQLSLISHKNSAIRVLVRDNAEYLKGKR
jgi:hypothetical protein